MAESSVDGKVIVKYMFYKKNSVERYWLRDIFNQTNIFRTNVKWYKVITERIKIQV